MGDANDEILRRLRQAPATLHKEAKRLAALQAFVNKAGGLLHALTDREKAVELGIAAATRQLEVRAAAILRDAMRTAPAAESATIAAAATLSAVARALKGVDGLGRFCANAAACFEALGAAERASFLLEAAQHFRAAAESAALELLQMSGDRSSDEQVGVAAGAGGTAGGGAAGGGGTAAVHRAAELLAEVAVAMRTDAKALGQTELAKATELAQAARSAVAANLEARVADAVRAAAEALRRSGIADAVAGGAASKSGGILAVASSQLSAASSWLREASELAEAGADRIEAELPDMVSVGTAVSTPALQASALDQFADKANHADKVAAAGDEWRKHCTALDDFLRSELQRERLVELLQRPLAALSDELLDEPSDADDAITTEVLLSLYQPCMISRNT